MEVGSAVDQDTLVFYYCRYWEIDEESSVNASQKRPYRIELVGVTCDTGLSVARGIWRKIRTGRSVPVPSQLRSHRLFSENFETFANLVDSATLYHTGKCLHSNTILHWTGLFRVHAIQHTYSEQLYCTGCNDFKRKWGQEAKRLSLVIQYRLCAYDFQQRRRGSESKGHRTPVVVHSGGAAYQSAGI